MGGDIAVESAAGEGSSFTITLPRNAAPAAELPAGPAATQSAAARKPTVLVIDDDAAARDLMRRFLTREQVHTVLASSGEEGLRLARELRPDLITLDVLMPGMDGWAVLQALKSDPELCDIPAVMSTIVTERGLGYALGASDFLVKPITRERLTEVLRKHQCVYKPCRVLLVEDDPEARSLLKSLLAKEGCEIDEAGDGAQALCAVAGNKPDLILLDLLLPNMDGFEFASELRKNEEWRRIPVIVLTAKDLSPEDRARLNGHVQRILMKANYSREDLLREIGEWAARSLEKSPGERGA